MHQLLQVLPVAGTEVITASRKYTLLKAEILKQKVQTLTFC